MSCVSVVPEGGCPPSFIPQRSPQRTRRGPALLHRASSAAAPQRSIPHARAVAKELACQLITSGYDANAIAAARVANRAGRANATTGERRQPAEMVSFSSVSAASSSAAALSFVLSSSELPHCRELAAEEAYLSVIANE